MKGFKCRSMSKLHDLYADMLQETLATRTACVANESLKEEGDDTSLGDVKKRRRTRTRKKRVSGRLRVTL